MVTITVIIITTNLENIITITIKIIQDPFKLPLNNNNLKKLIKWNHILKD